MSRSSTSMTSITKNTSKQNTSSAMCNLSMYSRLCMKMLSFLFVQCHVYYIYYVEFHFRFGRKQILIYGRVNFFRLSSFFSPSSFLMSSSFLRSSLSFWSHPFLRLFSILRLFSFLRLQK